MLLRGKSFRAATEECVQWGGEEFVLRGQVQRGEETIAVAVRYQKSSKRLWVEHDGQPVSPVTFFTRFPFVLFLPDDTFLFYRGPAQRRNFLNQTLVTFPQYLAALVQYQRALRQRNAALKTAKSADDIRQWTELLFEHAKPLWQQRQMLAEYLHNHTEELYRLLTGEKIKVEVELVYGTEHPTEYMRSLAEAWSQESRYHYTLYGPHRDDLEVRLGGRPAAVALSRGQMRSLVIALKLAVWRFLKHTTQETPLLLMDEVFAELDEERQARLIENLPAGQMLLTCTRLPAQLKTKAHVQMLDLRSILQGNQATKIKDKHPKITKQEETSPVPVMRV